MTDKNKNNYGEDYSCADQMKACPPIRNVTHPLRYYEFTQDEIKALEDCDKESFYRRCLPFSALFASVTYGAIKSGYVKTNPHFGVIPKVLVALLTGHVVGRVSYSPHCDSKLRTLPGDSKLGNLMRKYHKENNTPPGPKKS